MVVPAKDEAGELPGLLAALARQTDTAFELVVVDNASADATAAIARGFPAPFAVHVVAEAEPGAGTAADTGFRHAIGLGAELLLRTDADCRPRADWVATARDLVRGPVEFVAGRSVPRRDERPSLVERHVFPAAVRLAGLAGRRLHRDPAALAPFVLVHGHNIALTADLYARCGGTAREPLEAGTEDVTLLNRARRHTAGVRRAERLVVESSLRRLRAWGARRYLLWHWNRRWRPATAAEVHVR